MSEQDSASLTEAALAAFPAQTARVVAFSSSGDDAYVLVDVGPADYPYLYGVTFTRRGGRWQEGVSGNGPGWSRTGATEAVGTLAHWDQVSPRADRARLRFADSTVEVPVANGVCLATWWRIPCPMFDMPEVTSVRIDGRWDELP